MSEVISPAMDDGRNGLAASDRDWFAAELRTALLRLYDAHVLRASPLAQLAGLESAPDIAVALRQQIITAIERLHSAASDIPDPRAARVYNILRRRYIQQWTQERVALDVGLSVRQLQREEQAARAELADSIWDAWRLSDRSDVIQRLRRNHSARVNADQAEDALWEQELIWLERSAASELCAIETLLSEVLAIAHPALEAFRSQAAPRNVNVPFPVYLRVVIARQALLTLLIALARCAPDGRVAIDVQPAEGGVLFSLTTTAPSGAAPALPEEDDLSLRRLKYLIHRIDGSLVMQPATGQAGGWEARLTLPIAPPDHTPVDVLVVDDNPDALRLFERYLAGTRYRFWGARSVSDALQLADTRQPPLVVLDVVMPEQDGWSLLVRLRQRYQSRAPAIVVCSILGQKDLALDLGADDLLVKPVVRQVLLQTLDRQYQRLALSSG